jgi:hypothetical protein
MPEAAMDEYHCMLPDKYNVGAPGEIATMQPESQPHCVQA